MRALSVPPNYSLAHPALWSELILDENFPTPIPTAEQCLIRVYATGISRYELTWEGTYTTTNPRIPCFDIAGEIISSPEGSGFKDGDGVYGLIPWDQQGGLAEYVTVEPKYLARIPEWRDEGFQNRRFEYAASLPRAVLTAWQALRVELGGVVKPGMNILITGARGAVGRFGVQIARDIIGPKNEGGNSKVIALMGRKRDVEDRDPIADSSLYINADQASWAQDAKKFGEIDVVFDTIGGEVLEDSLRLVKDNGWVITVASPIPVWESIKGVEESRKRGVKEYFFIIEENGPQLREMEDLLTSGKLVPHIGHLIEGLTQNTGREISEQFEKPNANLGGGIVVRVFRP